MEVMTFIKPEGLGAVWGRFDFLILNVFKSEAFAAVSEVSWIL